MRLPGIRIFTLSVALTVISAINVSASGPAGIYAVIDKVVFEPNEQSPERIRLWGVFAFVSGSIKAGTILEDAPAQRGYLYFNMPADYTGAQKETVKKEWADLKSVAGTQQAVAFGDLFYVRAFSDVNDGNVYAIGSAVGIRVRGDTPSASALVPYSINTGIVKLPPTGNHETVVRRLKKGYPKKQKLRRDEYASLKRSVSGRVTKKLGLKVESRKSDAGERTYRIVGQPSENLFQRAASKGAAFAVLDQQGGGGRQGGGQEGDGGSRKK